MQGQCGPPTQRPYDIHSGNAVESLVQLFSTASVQYVPSWSKDMVALLRKVKPPGARAGPGPLSRGRLAGGVPPQQPAACGEAGGPAAAPPV